MRGKELFVSWLLLGISYFAYQHGVDVIPGDVDEVLPTKENPKQDFLVFEHNTFDKVEPGVVRLLNENGEKITEAGEAKLRPLLEALEISLERNDEKKNSKSIYQKINALKILPERQVNTLNAKRINRLLGFT